MKTASIVFTIVFLVILYAVGIVQGIVEVRGGDTVQFFDVFEDTFVTPVNNENAITEKCGVVAEKLAVIGAELARDEPVWSDAESAAEETLFSLQDIRKASVIINRHMTADTTEESIVHIDSLRNHVNALFGAIQDRLDIAEIKSMFTNIDSEARALAAQHGKVGAFKAARISVGSFFTSTAFKRKYLRGYESELEKTSVFANTLRPYMQFSRYLLFQDLGEKAVLGRNGWFFYKPDVDYNVRPWVLDKRSFIVDPNGIPFTDDPVRAVVKFKEQLEQMGIELLVVVIPGKPSVYPDMLNSSISASASGQITHSLRMIDEIKSRGVETVDLFTAFAEERTHDAEFGDSIYLQKDTHWKSRAVRRAAREVARRIKQYPWYNPGTFEYAIDSVVIDRVGDVGVMSTLPQFKIHDLNPVFATEATKCYQVFLVSRDETGIETGRTLYRDDFSNSTILLIGDSFSRIFQGDEPRSAGWISHIAAELSQPIASIVSDGGASTLVRQTLSRKTSVLKGKRLVIWEFVERDIRFGAEGWKDVTLEVNDWEQYRIEQALGQTSQKSGTRAAIQEDVFKK
jgi:hypothetical protein